VVCYAYYPGAQTLYDIYFKKQSSSNGTPSGKGHNTTPIPERTLWSYIVQLASAIKKVHDTGNPVRMVDPTKILVTGQNRLRIGSCGTLDVLMHATPLDTHLLQQEDLTLFSRLVFSLACTNVNAWTAPQFQRSLDYMARVYSPEMKSLALYLIAKPTPVKVKNIDHLMEMIRPRVQAEMEEALLATDRLEHELLSELENARLVRLLCKFGFINERPEFALEPRWSETGDRYIIKLFRDYVFHQVDETGSPVVNMSHVLTCLHKLDAGSEERIMLVSRDDTSCLVVSYKEIKACLEGAFSDLARPSTTGVVPFQPAR